jgi:acyl-coenzyme A synthetase/AMP-(fatty) acid ligase
MSADPPVVLWDLIEAAGDVDGRWIWAPEAELRLDALQGGSNLSLPLGDFVAQSVLLVIKDQFAGALAMIALDGIARRMVLCPPDIVPAHLPQIVEQAEIDIAVSDWLEPDALHSSRMASCSRQLSPGLALSRGRSTEWILLTSGTTGFPKLVAHTLRTLIGAIPPPHPETPAKRWATFYDIRRYGGLQIFLRAMIGRNSLLVSGALETPEAFLRRAGAHHVTHISGTPSHWRRALASPQLSQIDPGYIRLSGEVADQAVLDQLRAHFPRAGIAHAFASTEAGVAFSVEDGRAGFPVSLIASPQGGVEMKVQDGSLLIRSARTALGYLGEGAPALKDREGFVDTSDLVELTGDRYYFVGRRDGVINIGGLKVHPEEVERVLNSHPKVQMSLAKARRNAITGAVVVAEVVLKREFEQLEPAAELKSLERELLQFCRGQLAPHKVPAAVRFVPNLEMTQTGKLSRSS